MKLKNLRQKLKNTSKDRYVKIIDNRTIYQIKDVVYDAEKKACYIITKNLTTRTML